MIHNEQENVPSISLETIEIQSSFSYETWFTDSRTVYVAYSEMTLPTSSQKQNFYSSPASTLPTLYKGEHISYISCECEDPGRVANGFSKSTVIILKTGEHLGCNICVEWTLRRSC